MKMTTECIYCIFNQMDRNYGNFQKDADKRMAFMRGVCKTIAESDAESSAPPIVAELMSLVAKEAGSKDLYEKEKYIYNKAILDMEDDIIAHITNAPDKLYRALQYAMTGNYIDFGNSSGVSKEKLHELIEAAVDIDLGEAYDELKEDLKKAETLLFVHDNSGEIVFDKICIAFIKELYPKLKITSIVRGFPVLNDVTIADAKEVGLSDIVPVVDNGMAIPGTIIDEISQEAKELFYDADILISKGMGNYETMEGCGLNIYYMLLCKCERFMREFGKPRYSSVFCREK